LGKLPWTSGGTLLDPEPHHANNILQNRKLKPLDIRFEWDTILDLGFFKELKNTGTKNKYVKNQSKKNHLPSFFIG
jgi:hypothetical protein